MRRLLLASLLASACGTAPVQPGPPTAKLDAEFELRLGQAVRVGPEALHVGFTAVVSDSRCPVDVQCIQAGEAVLGLGVGRPNEAVRVELRTPGRGSSAEVLGHRVSAVRLSPLPRSTVEIAPSDYALTLVVSRI